jgi:heme-degrading monooxygenase HmoA
MILRKWTGTIRARDKAAYLAYIRRTGMREYRATPGNRGAQMVTRDLPRERVEVTTLSWWDDLESIRGFAGDDIERAHYYPMDRKYLLTRPAKVHHFEVDDGLPPRTRRQRSSKRRRSGATSGQ